MANKKSKVSNVPNLRFPRFSGEWTYIRLGEMATFSKGKGISKSDINENGTTITEKEIRQAAKIILKGIGDTRR
jgi:hypothetical protein